MGLMEGSCGAHVGLMWQRASMGLVWYGMVWYGRGPRWGLLPKLISWLSLSMRISPCVGEPPCTHSCACTHWRVELLGHGGEHKEIQKIHVCLGKTSERNRLEGSDGYGSMEQLVQHVHGTA